MDDKSSLLQQLRIDRSGEPAVTVREPRSGRRWIVVVIGAVVLAGLGFIGWRQFLRPSAIPVRVAVAREPSGRAPSASGASLLDASGYVVARREATVSAKIVGRLREVLIEAGDRVAANQIVARLDDSNTRAALDQAQASLGQQEASLDAAKVALEDQRPIFDRMQRQRASSVISAQDFDNAKSTFDAVESDYRLKSRIVEGARATLAIAQRNQDDTIVRAPFAGVVTDKAAQPGEIVSPSSAGGGFTRTGICTIVDMDSLESEVDVSENFIQRVHAGQPATVHLNAYPDWDIPASVLAIIPTADRSKATVKVRVGFKAKDPRILPEMGARVAFLSDTSAPASSSDASSTAPSAERVLLPSDAVQVEGDTGTVYVIEGSSVARRSVRLGGHTSDGQLMVSGVSAGTRVAVGDFARLSDNARVSVQE
jgi:RND family efflux transporter MFP subunit